MKRVLVSQLQKDIHKKILILTGPRQSGKTTLSKMIGPDFEYLNYDQIQHRKTVHEQSWDRKKDYVILDEIHKMKNWKRFLKGIYDTEGLHPGLMITGSARLDAYKKMGDSLAGRFFQYRLHPLDVRELITLDPKSEPKKCIERILRFGGFPEPYLEGTEGFYTKWKKSHIDIILRQDMIDLESVRNLVAIETMVELLKSRVGNPLSYQSLSEDLQYSDKTIKNWIRILENMYVIFKIQPFHHNIARSNLKQPKFYFFDVGQVQGDIGYKLENLVACSLLKECHYRQDVLGQDYDLHYLSKKGGIEIDFLITKNKKPHLIIEVKHSDHEPSKNFKQFEKDLPKVHKVQLVHQLKREKTYPSGIEIREVSKFLSTWK